MHRFEMKQGLEGAAANRVRATRARDAPLQLSGKGCKTTEDRARCLHRVEEARRKSKREGKCEAAASGLPDVLSHEDEMADLVSFGKKSRFDAKIQAP